MIFNLITNKGNYFQKFINFVVEKMNYLEAEAVKYAIPK